MKASRVQWTTQEDSLILEMLENGKSYADVSRALPNRSTLQIRMHHNIIRGKRKINESRETFALEEDWLLIKAVAAKGRLWKLISENTFQGSRTGPQLSMRWRTLSSLLFVSNDADTLEQRLKMMHSLSKKKRAKALFLSVDEKLGDLFHTQRANIVQKEKREEVYSGDKTVFPFYPLTTPQINQKCDERTSVVGCQNPSLSSIMLQAERIGYGRPDLPNIVSSLRTANSSSGYNPCIHESSPSDVIETRNSRHPQYLNSWSNVESQKKEHCNLWASVFENRCCLIMLRFQRFGVFGVRIHDYSIMHMRTTVRKWIYLMQTLSVSCIANASSLSFPRIDKFFLGTAKYLRIT